MLFKEKFGYLVLTDINVTINGVIADVLLIKRTFVELDVSEMTTL